MSFRASSITLGVYRRLATTTAVPVRGSRSRWRPVLGLVVLGGTVWMAQEGFFHKIVDLKQAVLLHAEAPLQSDHTRTPSDPGSFRKDLETDIEFPTSLQLTSPGPPLTLVGLGVRKVSFLRVKVYSAGFYLEDSETKRLDSIPGWHSFSAQHLLTPPTSKPADPLGAPQLSGEALMQSLLDRPVGCAIRIVPVRNTDFGHLRDGFTRALAARQKLARSAGALTESDEARVADSIQSLKSIMAAGSVPKGKSLVLLRTAGGALIFEYEGKVLGSVNDSWVAREMILSYFADKDVISPKLKEDVAMGLEGFIKH